MNLEVAGRDLTLSLRPQSFFQTNTEAAQVLYTRAVEWLDGIESAWDLYCGIGGFGLALASRGTRVVGVESDEQAVFAAGESAAAMGVPAEFVAADANEWVRGQSEVPEAIVVNPPRRGIGPELAEWIEASGVRTVLYSSCHVHTLAKDLAVMSSYRVTRAQVVDMFPHTKHFEVVALLERSS